MQCWNTTKMDKENFSVEFLRVFVVVVVLYGFCLFALFCCFLRFLLYLQAEILFSLQADLSLYFRFLRL